MVDPYVAYASINNLVPDSPVPQIEPSIAQPTSWNGYPKVHNLGHPQIFDLTTKPVYIEEKVDGSQFSFMVDWSGRLFTRSKGTTFYPETAPAMFAPAVRTALDLVPQLIPGYTYRGEVLSKPKHNTLAYGRVPQGNFILFDVAISADNYMSRSEKEAEAARLGLEIVPLLNPSHLLTLPDELLQYLERESVLGGCKIEGVVLKQINPTLFTVDGKPMVGKFVSAAFKEANKSGGWKEGRESSTDILVSLIQKYANENRWKKAIQHMRDDSKLTDSPKDIGPLMGVVAKDISDECSEEIKEALFKWAWRRIAAGSTRGLPEFYKRYLLDQQFEATREQEKPPAQFVGIGGIDAGAVWGAD